MFCMLNVCRAFVPRFDRSSSHHSPGTIVRVSSSSTRRIGQFVSTITDPMSSSSTTSAFDGTIRHHHYASSSPPPPPQRLYRSCSAIVPKQQQFGSGGSLCSNRCALHCILVRLHDVCSVPRAVIIIIRSIERQYDYRSSLSIVFSV